MAEGDGAGGEEEEPLVYDDRDVLQVREGELPEEEEGGEEEEALGGEEEEEEEEREVLGGIRAFGGGGVRTRLRKEAARLSHASHTSHTQYAQYTHNTARQHTPTIHHNTTTHM